MLSRVWVLISASLLALPGTSSAAASGPVYKDARAPIEARVRDLLGRMTLEEKVAQLQSTGAFPVFPNAQAGPTAANGIVKAGKVDRAIAKRALGEGIGVFANVGPSLTAMSMAERARQDDLIQDWVLKNTRLGVPVLFQSEALHGAVAGGATSFPQAVALGSTWDRALLRQVFGVVARESRESGVSMVLAPVFDLSRDPRYGRVEEMYSEDPYLAGELGVAAVRGLQGDGETIDGDHVIATAKHFVHGQPEGGANTAPNDYSDRTMRSVFLAPFEKAVKEARIAAIMPSYNENDGGVPTAVDSRLLKDILRQEWGFTGVTDSDWFEVARLVEPNRVASDIGDAGIQAFNAGVDMESPVGAGFPALVAAVKEGKVKEQDVDAAVARVLTLKFRAGLFEHPFSTAPKSGPSAAEPSTAALARRAADEAMVLLKNDGGLLPLDPAKLRKVAVIGPNADKVRLGGYSALPHHAVTVLDGVRSRLGDKVQVSFAEGVRLSEPDSNAVDNKMTPYVPPSREKDEAGIAQAVATARDADVVVLVLGENEVLGREAFPFPGMLGDVDTLELRGRQNELVRAIAKLGKPTVAVLLNGRALAAQELYATAPAVIEGWYLGQEAGDAVAGVLFGDVNPSGKLPVTIPRNVGQLPVYYYQKPQSRFGYVASDLQPLFPFGFGLSYTSFSYGQPTLDRAQIGLDGTATVSVRITNTGKRNGDEVVQMYVHPQVSSVVQPVKRLAGFERVHLAAGASATVEFKVGPEQLAIWDRQMKRSVEPGKVDIMVGPNSAQLDAVELNVSR